MPKSFLTSFTLIGGDNFSIILIFARSTSIPFEDNLWPKTGKSSMNVSRCFYILFKKMIIIQHYKESRALQSSKGNFLKEKVP